MDESMKHRIVGSLVLLAGSFALAPLVLRGQAVWSSSPPVSLPPPPVIVHPVQAQQFLSTDSNSAMVSSQGSAINPVSIAESASTSSVSSMSTVISPLTEQNQKHPDPLRSDTEDHIKNRVDRPKVVLEEPIKARQAKEQASDSKIGQSENKKKQAALVPPGTQSMESVASAKLATEGWTIQVASLEHVQAAEHLSADLRKKGFHVYTRQTGSAWKVFVGPELDHANAEILMHKLADVGVQGWMQHYTLPVEDSVP